MKLFDSNEYDVVVIGAGPAGAAAAAVGARKGLSVLLLERDSAPRFKLGESLMPATYSTLEKMGAIPRMKRDGYVEKHSVQFFTKTGKSSSPFYFDTVRHDDSARTWQVLRSDFDQMLIEVAEEAGAECRRGARVHDVLFDQDRARGVLVETEGERTEVAAKVVVDATGQSSLLGKKLDLRRVDYGLRHASIYTHFRGAFRASGRDEGATLILHTTDGVTWFWYIPLADDIVSVGVVGRVEDLISNREGRPHEIFFEEVSKCAEIEQRISGAVQCRPVSVAKDFSYRYERMAGDGWVLIGDAFSFVDPVYSSGVFFALKSGEMVAESIARGMRRGDLSARQLGDFRGRLMGGVDAVRQLVEAFYNPGFSFGDFLRAYPHHQRNVTRILVGDVLDAYFGDLFAAMAKYHHTFTPTNPVSRRQVETARG